MLSRYGIGGAANPENTDPREMEVFARFHRGRASLAATFPVNLFRRPGREGVDVRRACGNSAPVISVSCNISV